jgi:hypothetical protein
MLPYIGPAAEEAQSLVSHVLHTCSVTAACTAVGREQLMTVITTPYVLLLLLPYVG